MLFQYGHVSDVIVSSGSKGMAILEFDELLDIVSIVLLDIVSIVDGFVCLNKGCCLAQKFSKFRLISRILHFHLCFFRMELKRKLGNQMFRLL